MPDDFTLDPRLAADSFALGRLALCETRLFNDARFPWLIVVPRRAGLVEIIDLDTAGRAMLMQEIAYVSEALRAVTQCHKLNVAALGNQVRQLHVHVIARFENDAAWPNPIWGGGTPQPYAEDAAVKFSAQIQAAIGLR